MKNIAVLISGSGSNLQAIIDKCEGEFPAKIKLVISNKASAYGLTRAAEHGIDSVVIDNKLFPDRESFDNAIHDSLLENNIDFVCLAGFMRVLTSKFVNKWQGKMINIHPSLLPKYKGLDTHQRAIDAKDSHAGCTVHWVSAEVDAGEIICQKKVEIANTDTAESLAKKVLEQEHICYSDALEKIFKDYISR